ncbi:MAG TPA: FkbM family methyltransferase [Dehalococcoidia bacterium]|nr:FkbM family methyltransferase [Dehalococcoidia bacterium]
MVAKAEQLQDGATFIELKNGIKYYGAQDGIASEQDVTHDVIQKLDKLQKLEHSRTILGVLCTQYVKAEYEKCYKLQKGDIVVDAGAHIGTFTIKAAKAVGDKGRVIAIEPSENNLEFLSRNIEANGLQNVTIVPKGVWGTKGTLKLSISCRRTTGHSFYTSEQFGTEDTEEYQEVEVDTIDNIVRQSGVGPVNFLKMDIEGAEVEAIKGMDETMSGDVKLAMEISHIVAGHGTYQVVIPWLKNKGFQVHRDGRMVYARKNN